MAKLLRPNTPIPIEVVEEMWITLDEDGNYLLGLPTAVISGTGKGAPGAVTGIQKIIAPGTRIAIILP